MGGQGISYWIVLIGSHVPYFEVLVPVLKANEILVKVKATIRRMTQPVPDCIRWSRRFVEFKTGRSVSYYLSHTHQIDSQSLNHFPMRDSIRRWRVSTNA